MPKITMEQFQKNSYLASNNAWYIETLYENFLKDPKNVTKEWRDYFQNLVNDTSISDVSHSSMCEEFHGLTNEPHLAFSSLISPSIKQASVDSLIENYRRFGHLNANINPLGDNQSIDNLLKLSHYNLTESDFNKTFITHHLLDKPKATLKEIYTSLREIYCSSIGIQYSSISNEHERSWLYNYVEHRLRLMAFNKEKT